MQSQSTSLSGDHDATADLAGPSRAPEPLSAGALAPDFTLPASLAGQPFDYALRDGLRRGTVVVYFYPSAFTSGCNVQAHTFARELDQFTAAGASVIGVSLDDIERLHAFSRDPEYCAGRLAVACDARGEVARAFGLPVEPVAPGKTDSRGEPNDHDRVPRTTFVVRADGRIAATLTGLGAAEHVEQALAWARRLAAPRGA
ncbi:MULTISPECIES: peroxiredoxin [unclassified Burkholderia]|uniref:peroxiredoxin n=1 Tax=unclassified Burkholderia TaxID=2613784 RepID=UPI001198FB34|nr:MULTISPECIES: peroxiredoxin [unclassified Burkholderia]TWC59655.1 peroxiredoxin [Burkholderia sp. SJZ089]TWC94632.1 peroxiredoxin [Burkholderia sp. SJZ115]TWC96544.1 peroxiredoxin [Burkholderia sp. SJZ091]